ncbi:hypothetical protein COLO4_03016 [Corchorus olitorius]|uniref:Uncharacterized protein n=1 Tax=Corchorus olitorius TaxID=93759 RepID=A0A1R3KZV2_9ROSI|nr:hypothetical protein COLO4_03016 [Corchorus olitorius]
MADMKGPTILGRAAPPNCQDGERTGKGKISCSFRTPFLCRGDSAHIFNQTGKKKTY